LGRWRPPAESSTALVTPEGHARLKAELDDLWRVRRPEVVKALAAAAAEGDRSENAEYTYRKKQLGEIDRRVRYLGKRLETLRVVDTVPSDPQAVFFGAIVEVGTRRAGRSRAIASSARTRPTPAAAGSASIRRSPARC
jgi:transcription elongation factor GreB